MSITDDVASSRSGVDGMQKTAAPPIDLLTCEPDELASWLNAHRFHNNAMDVASFLLQSTAALPNAEEISAHLMGGGGEGTADDASTDNGKAETKQDESAGEATALNNNDDATTSTDNDLGEAISTFSSLEVSCINPRGKFLLSLHDNGIMLQNPKKEEEQIIISKEAVEHAVWFRKPEDYRSLKQLKEGSKKPIPGHMVLMCLEDGITFRNKALKQVCFQLPSYAAPSVETDEDIKQKDWHTALNSALMSENEKITCVRAKMDTQTCNTKKGYMFQAGEGSGNTSTTTAGMPFVGCNRGFNNGALFPLQEGLLFFKPPLFVPRSSLASISCGRGSGQSRFVDMVVQLDDDDESTLEFTNIERDELQGLNEYIHNVLIPAMKKDAAEGSDKDGDEEDRDEDDDDDVAMAEVVNSSDEDSDSDESSGQLKRKSSRAASKSAREATRAHFAGLDGGDDEDDEDSDVDPFNEEEDDSDGSDEESDSEVVKNDYDDDESGEEEESDDSEDDDCSFEVERSSKKAKLIDRED